MHTKCMDNGLENPVEKKKKKKSGTETVKAHGMKCACATLLGNGCYECNRQSTVQSGVQLLHQPILLASVANKHMVGST